ncbi:MAG TPA: hypothetical protein VLA19_18540 [Herpetosiphonaceae bacterium]|nr:hypothetical protein [Herpetosiphonaceae bacterium]
MRVVDRGITSRYTDSCCPSNVGKMVPLLQARPVEELCLGLLVGLSLV